MPSRGLNEAAEQGLVWRSVRLVLAGVGVSVLDCTRRATGDMALREILYLSATCVRLKHLLGSLFDAVPLVVRASVGGERREGHAFALCCLGEHTHVQVEGHRGHPCVARTLGRFLSVQERQSHRGNARLTAATADC
jgi:hypothetical protein